MNAAFKDWAIIVDALGHGQQTLILRKGGISEGQGGFKLEHSSFLLFPTLYHQQRDGVIPSAQNRFDQLPPEYRDPSHTRIEFLARVVEWMKVDDLAAAQRLQGQHIWTPQVISERFDWGREQTIFAIAIRVFRLAQPRDVPNHDSYAGCKSWIQLTQDIPTEHATPVLSDAEFENRLIQFREALAGHSTAAL